jgi:hypothetical protein
MNGTEIMKLLASFLLEGLCQKPDNELFLLEENCGNAHIFGTVQQEVSLSTHFLHFVDNKKCQRCETRYNCENCGVVLRAAPFPTLPMVANFWKHERGLSFKKWLRSV